MREPDFPVQEKGFHVEGTAGAKALGWGWGCLVSLSSSREVMVFRGRVVGSKVRGGCW